MSEIKFRAWYKPNLSQEELDEEEYKGWMTEPSRSITDWDIKRGMGFVIDCDSGFYTDDFIYMLFSGHKDKKGVEIYEGDILEDMSGNLYKVDPIVPFNRIQPAYNDWMSWPEEYTIVGNIYENPELIDKLWSDY